MEIVNIYHQIWFQGESNIPEKYEKFYKSCMKINSNYKRIIWDSETIKDLIKNNYPEYLNFYEKLPLMVQKIDFAKYVILYHYGGVYIDMDVKCLKNIDDLKKKFPDADFIVSELPMNKIELKSIKLINNLNKRVKKMKRNKLINNGIILSKKKLDFLLILIEEIINNFYYKHNKNLRDIYIFVTTGPIIFTNVILNYKGISNIKVIDNKYMEPCTVLMKKCDFTDSYFHHEHQRTWGTSHLERIIKTIKIFNKNRNIILIFIIIIAYIIYRNRKKLKK
jgi:inositol phosphorylceramide mannosyltransferase catalytic subunit